MLNDPASGPHIESDPQGPVHLVFQAIRTSEPAHIEAARRACEPPTTSWGLTDLGFATCLTGLATLGDLDAVFRLAERGYGAPPCCSAAEIERKWLISGGLVYPRTYILGPAMAKVRADRRFIGIARRTGLLAYWQSGHPPDFCSVERAPVCDLLRPEVTDR